MRLIEQPPEIVRRLLPDVLFRGDKSKKIVYITFDDGPIPEVTPWVLNCLEHYGVKATFFMVGDNVRRYPELFEQVVAAGHGIGNHSMHHLQGIRNRNEKYITDVGEAAGYIKSRFYRPPHGLMRPGQLKALSQSYTLVLHDVVTRDYSKRLNAGDVFENVRRLTRNGSIIVFHDSMKSRERLLTALPRSLEWLIGEGYEFHLLENDF